MQIYKSKHGLLPGTSYAELIKVARHQHRLIQKKSPHRYAYIRSRYFKRDKIFIDQFWEHLNQKLPADRKRRIKLYKCAIDVIKNCPYSPDTRQNPSKSNEILHRFTARTKDGELFCVQIRENKVKRRKDFMSVFPAK